ncbi:glucose-1-phosphate adenylyltransferase [Cerasicoccus arenae]|uniref:Glucose-1-phosphate adenylyltransferase n=1 Tax=Cerasicoccus arenae TaxID=424488 RepID=A0A8J3GCD4_9BACT|nr:glucose-1-phosphate adenylyltransferase [Cerasicoccus arenae]MBK1859737.1 glucose-1-phosphate adenylyltransferase [Cerasicoccus arenae]GHB93510.1 glucose-1-phosphate adenylyltransferase [Cerasicoccus arenae]
MNQNVISVIMGGGRGTRLYPLTKERCKPAVPLAGKYRLVDIPISNCLNSGINRIHLLSQFNTASLHNHIQSTYQFDPFGGGYVDIMSAEQTDKGEGWYQGTADAVRQNLHHFNFGKNDLFLILSGDQLYRMDFRKIIDHHNSLGSDVTIAAKAMHKSEVEGLGVMRVDDDYSIQEFVEKPTDQAVIDSLVIGDKLRATLDGNPEDVVLASMGIYVFSAQVMIDALSGDETDFGKEIIPGLLGKISLNSYIFDDYWEDIGTVAAFFDANLALTDDIPPFNFFDSAPIYTRARYLPATKVNGAQVERALFGGGSIISHAKIKHCIIGVRSIVGDGSELTDVVMMGGDEYEMPEDRKENAELQRPNIGVGKNCKINRAIIDKNARIGDDVELSPEGKPDGWSEGDLYVRDGIILVMKSGVVPSGTKVRP